MDDRSRKRRRRRRRFLAVLVVLAIGLWLSRSWWSEPAVPDGSYLLLEVAGNYPEQAPDQLFALVTGERPITLLDLLTVVRDAGEDDRVAGIVVRVRTLDIGWAKAQDIREALVAFRQSGKPLHALLEQEFAGSTMEYYIASVAEKVYVTPGGTTPVNGLLTQYVFLGGVWEKLDIDMQVEQIREYKTAGDMLRSKEMSPYHREMANSLLDSTYGQVVEGIAAARGIEPGRVRAAINASPARAEELEHWGLADGAKFLDELRIELVGADGAFLAATEYKEHRGSLLKEAPRHGIAVIYGVGTITTGESHGGAVESRTGMGADTITEAFRQAISDKEVQAIVFRVNSPGGSALASDLIWRATQEARTVKPVIVSMSDIAGSGGYYVAAGATRIVAQPATLTGSIGVVVAKPDVSGFLAKLGVNTTRIARGRFADLMSLSAKWDEEEVAYVKEAIDSVYDVFVERVAAGRHLTTERVNAVGRGRVWTGRQAQANGLVDELGGFFAAIAAAKTAAAIPVAEKAKVTFYPQPKRMFERLAKMLAVRWIGEPPRWWQRVQTLFAAFDFPAGSALTLMPMRIEIR